MSHPKRMFWFSPRDRWLIDCRHTAPHPLTQLCYTAGNFEQCSCCLAEANMFCPRVATEPITSYRAAENYFQPNQTLL